MKALHALLLVAAASPLFAGCGQAPEANPQAASSRKSATSDAAQNPVTQVVAVFLDAVKRGDTHAASAQLTPLALERINANNMTISPPASETARFTIGAFEIIEGDKAIVETVWTDLDVDGQSYDQHTTWALRQGDGQWRISGMAEDMGPDQEPMIIDFENPAALAQPQAAPGSDGARQANQPTEDPFQTR